MPPRDPLAIQLDFPLLVADLIEQLRLTGTMGLLNFLPEVRPTFIVGSREGAITFRASPVTYKSSEVFDGTSTNPTANTVIADTGQLPAGTYDMFCQMSFNGTTPSNGQTCLFQHQNAANSATLAILMSLPTHPASKAVSQALPIMGYEIATNERFRVVSPAETLSGGLSASIYAAIRPAP